MTSKEIVQRTIGFRDPPRIPVAIGNMELPDDPDLSGAPCLRAWQETEPDDLVTITYAAADGGPVSKVVDERARIKIDEWGVKWIAGLAVEPPLASWDAWPAYCFPDPLARARFDGVRQAIETHEDKYVMGLVWNSTFERMWMLRGFENLLMDPVEHPALFCELRDRYLEFNLAILDQWLSTPVDAIYFGDDLGTQNGLIMSPATWRRHYRPMVEQLFGRTRAAGKDVSFHSCGDITEILPDLVDCGMNILNPVQPHAMNVRTVLQQFGADLVIWGATDLQHLIAHGTPQEVENEIKEIVSLCWRGGGYIGGTAQGCPPGTPIENIEAFYRAFGRIAGIEGV